MTNPTSNFGWQMPTPTDLVTDLPADFEVFGQAVDTTLADLKGGTSGQILSKASATDMDFTWITNDIGDITAVNVTSPVTGGGTSGAVSIGVSAASTSASGVVQLSDSTSTTSSVLASTPTATKSAYDLANTANTTANAAISATTLTTAGDVIYRNSTVPTRLGIGTAGQVLTVNTGATAPEWKTPSAGGKTLTQITSGNLSGSSINLTGLTQDIFVLRVNGAAASNGYLGLQINGQTATSSKYQYMNNRHNSNGTQTCQNVTSDDRFYITSTAGTSAINAYITITNSAQAGFHNINFIGSNDNGSVITYTGSAMWVDASAITSLQIIQPNFSAGTYTLWGA